MAKFVTLFALVLALCLAAVVVAQPSMNRMPPPPEEGDVLQHQTEFVDDDNVQEPEIDGDGSISGSENVQMPTSCDSDPNSAECKEERARAEQPMKDLAAEERQMKAYEVIVERIEILSNEWCCAVSGLPLYNVPGDKDVFSYTWNILSQSFLSAGQQYGSQLVTQYHNLRKTLPIYDCENLEQGDSQYFDHPVNTLLETKEKLEAWLKSNEVAPQDITSTFFQEFRGIYGRWMVARTLLQKKQSDSAPVPEEAIIGILPLLKQSADSSSSAVSASDMCMIGSQLESMFATTNTRPKSAQLATHIGDLLDGCLKDGRVARKPQEFGEMLLDAGREKAARELFDIAVQRGSLCNAMQRPDQHHRKDLSAAPFWTLDSFPASTRPLINAVVDKISKETDNIPYSLETEMMSSFLDDKASGTGAKWERTIVFGNNQWNRTVISALKNETVDAFAELLDELVDTNDGYAFSCNGSIVIDIWRMWPGSVTRRSTGQTNIILQLLTPLIDSNRLNFIATAGGESMALEFGDIGIMDDSFENVLRVDGDEGIEPLVMLHLQVCHPEMHDKAMDIGKRRCAGKPKN